MVSRLKHQKITLTINVLSFNLEQSLTDVLAWIYSLFFRIFIVWGLENGKHLTFIMLCFHLLQVSHVGHVNELRALTCYVNILKKQALNWVCFVNRGQQEGTGRAEKLHLSLSWCRPLCRPPRPPASSCMALLWLPGSGYDRPIGYLLGERWPVFSHTLLCRFQFSEAYLGAGKTPPVHSYAH